MLIMNSSCLFSQKYNQRAVFANTPMNVRYLHKEAYASCLSGVTFHVVKSLHVGILGIIYLSFSFVSII